MIEAIAKIFADSAGPLGLVLFGCFVMALISPLVLAYALIHVLATLHDDKALRFQNGIYKDRRNNPERPVKFGLLMRTVRRIRRIND